MPRYEFSEASSSKFWQIEVTGPSFTTTYGRIGTAGQRSTKSFETEAVARVQYEERIAEKTGKGYVPVGAQE